jgi:hypothetical protein
LLVLGMLGAAVYTELSKEPELRTGEGLVGGVVPYDFRPPSPEKLKSALWNPDDDRLFVPTAIGVGWMINFARLFQMVSAAR